jgi:two-component system response regulator QseB
METGARGAAPRLLYVEDDRVIAEMTIEVLSETYEVTPVTDGRHALERALSERFDVMVIDRRLPDLDGASLVASVRTARITTPILLLTALGAVADRVDGLDAGANDYLVKPFDFDELLARLRALVRGHPCGGRREIGEWAFLPDADVAYGPAASASRSPHGVAPALLLSESPEHVFSRQEILRAVFTSDDALSSVDTYVHYIRRKTSPARSRRSEARLPGGASS